MSFPGKPRTDDETRSEFIRLCSVRDYPHVFVLGCFARYVTIHSQQVRALNLIDALLKHGEIGEGSSVAVIGGGIAGLTAAAAAARRGVAKVQVFESEPSLMRLQRNCRQRYIHPHIYDWPTTPTLDETAGLPIMDWRADIAANVVQNLDAQWKDYLAQYSGVLRKPITRCGRLTIHIVNGRPIVEPAKEKEFDAVILAVGFGVDATKDTDEYWADARIDRSGLEKQGYRWLVSGTGDGGLTDLMRLCILDMQHGKLIEAVSRIGHDVGEELAKKERSLYEKKAAGHEYADVYEQAADELPGEAAEILQPRNVGEVLLNSSRDSLYLPTSSVLNRLIVAFLRKQKRFDFLTPPGRMLDPVEKKNGFEAVFEDRKHERVTFVIQRHGPDKALKLSFPEIWGKTERIRREWKDASLYSDWTKQPLWSDADFSDDSVKATALRRINFSEKARCVMITPQLDEEGAAKVKFALEVFERRGAARFFEGKGFDTQPLEMPVSGVFSDSAAYERAIRALCDAPIAIFDITEYDSAVLLLLGVRSAVRRGVTITVMTGDIPNAGLPFNIVSLNPMPYDRWKIADALETGFSALRKQPEQYLDLPAYDAVRRLGEDHRPLEPGEQILLLRWFHPGYVKLSEDIVRQPIELEYKITRKADTPIVTTLDSRSPQLVPQRLYAAIRRTRLCVVDWSGWRPNVFFEMGVRLAVNRVDPLSILCRKKPARWPKGEKWPKEPASANLLVEFFRPAGFTFPSGYESIQKRIQDFRSDGVLWAEGAMISPGRTHRVISESVHWQNESGGLTVYEMLSREAYGMAGPPSPEDGKGVRVLFGETHSDSARMASLEYLFAAWFYLYHRYGIDDRLSQDDKTLKKDPVIRELERIGAEIAGRSLNTRNEEQRKIARQIFDTMNRIGATILGTADVIERARRLRAEAINARQSHDWKKAQAALEEAIDALNQTLRTLVSKRKESKLTNGERTDAGVYEKGVVRQLIHTLGAKGGVLRARKEYVSAVRAYDEGYEKEKEAADEYDIRNTYNLTQRLITRVFVNPLGLAQKSLRVEKLFLLAELGSATRDIQDQLRGGRTDDEYALADLAWTSVLLGDEQWENRWFDFLDSQPEPYAVEVNARLMDFLIQRMSKVHDPKLDAIRARLNDSHRLLRA